MVVPLAPDALAGAAHALPQGVRQWYPSLDPSLTEHPLLAVPAQAWIDTALLHHDRMGAVGAAPGAAAPTTATPVAALDRVAEYFVGVNRRVGRVAFDAAHLVDPALGTDTPAGEETVRRRPLAWLRARLREEELGAVVALRAFVYEYPSVN